MNIINPINCEKIKLLSLQGKELLKAYINNFNGGKKNKQMS